MSFHGNKIGSTILRSTEEAVRGGHYVRAVITPEYRL